MSVEGGGRCWLVGGERPRTRLSQRTRVRMCSLNVNVRFMASEGPFEDRAGCGCVAPSVAFRSVAIESLYTKLPFTQKLPSTDRFASPWQCKPRRPHLEALWLVVRKPRLVLAEYRATRNEATAKTRTAVLGCGDSARKLVTGPDGELHNKPKPAHAVPLASARQQLDTTGHGF